VTTQKTTTSVSNFIHQITLEAAYQIASNLRPEDRREIIEGYGIEPTMSVPLDSLKGFCRYFTVPNGENAGIVGIIDDKIWMLCTPAIHQYPLTFARESSVLGSIGGGGAAARQNAYALKIWKKKIHNERIQAASRNADYKNRKTQYSEQLINNSTAAQRAYFSEQSRINEVFKQMNFAEQGSQIKEQEQLGKLQAREVSGKSADRARTILSGNFGRNTAIRQEQLRTTMGVAQQRNEQTREQLKIANRSAYYKTLVVSKH
jgi:hypothetical protein